MLSVSNLPWWITSNWESNHIKQRSLNGFRYFRRTRRHDVGKKQDTNSKRKISNTKKASRLFNTVRAMQRIRCACGVTRCWMAFHVSIHLAPHDCASDLGSMGLGNHYARLQILFTYLYFIYIKNRVELHKMSCIGLYNLWPWISQQFWQHSSSLSYMLLVISAKSAKWTEWNWRWSCFHLCVRVSVHSQSHWFEWVECWEMYSTRAWKVENISIRII